MLFYLFKTSIPSRRFNLPKNNLNWRQLVLQLLEFWEFSHQPYL